MTTLREAAQQALDALEFFRGTAICAADTDTANEAITALRSALAQEHKRGTVDRAEWLADKLHNGGDYGKEAALLLVKQAKELAYLCAALAQEQEPNPPGCDHCNHPLYAATKCRVCGRVTERPETVRNKSPIRMSFEWVGGQWLFNDKPIESGEWNITLKDDGWVIYPKMEHAAPKVTMLVDPRDPQRAYMAQVETQNYREAWTMQTSPSPEAEPVQEPVAWTLTKTLTKRETTTNGYLWFSDPVNSSWTPLYTSPPQRKPLTEEEIERIRADEREACAKVCDEQHDKARTETGAARADACARAIRARSKE